jgi:hypothetical protein
MSIFSRMKQTRQDEKAVEAGPAQQPASQPQNTQATYLPPPKTNPVTPPANFSQDSTYEQLKQLKSVEQTLPKQNEYAHPEVTQPRNMIEKMTTQVVEEDIMEITDEEKREFIFFYEEKYRMLYKDMESAFARMEDLKIKEKRMLEESYRKQAKLIDEKYEQQKKAVETKYSPQLEKFKNMANKFKMHLGGNQYETKSRSDAAIIRQFENTYGGHIPPPPEIPPRFPTRQPRGFEPLPGTASYESVPGPEIDESYLNKSHPEDPELSRILKDLDSKHGFGHKTY